MSQLTRVRIFEDLPAAALQRGAVTTEPRNGTEIFAQADPADALYAIVGGEGRVRIGAIDRRSKRLMVEVFGLSEVFGETPLLGINLSRMLAQRLRPTFELLQDATFATIEVRLARQLIYLAELHGRPTDVGLVVGTRLKQQDLADLLGATTRSIITVLNGWRTAGLVRYDSDQAQVVISDEAALRRLFGP